MFPDHGGFSDEGFGQRFFLALFSRIYAVYLWRQYAALPLYTLSGAEKQRKIHYGTFAVSAGVRTPVPDLQVPET